MVAQRRGNQNSSMPINVNRLHTADKMLSLAAAPRGKLIGAAVNGFFKHPPLLRRKQPETRIRAFGQLHPAGVEDVPQFAWENNSTCFIQRYAELTA